ncbi:recombinase family protein [Streptomyces sp. NPDC001743]|uniref:recombinase family protein n=1 Tax=Streptomyces sp. NPDC001743 TaxID=3154397 RepID=UPI003333BD6C
MTTLTDALGADDDLLGIFPARPTEIRIGYARVSKDGQKLDRQLDALTLAGRRRIFPEKKSGKNDLRPELKACHAFLQAGGTLVVPSHDRVRVQYPGPAEHGRRAAQAGDRAHLPAREAPHDAPGARLIFHVFAALAKFIRELIVQGTNEGLAAARARGRVGGRPTVATPELLRAPRDLLPNPANSVETIAKLLGVSAGPLYNHIPAQLEGSNH